MMQVGLYSVRDSKAGTYGPVQTARNSSVLIRDMQEYLRSEPTSVVAQHPEDFEIYCLATLNDETGEVWSPEYPELIVKVSALVVKSE